MTNHQIGMSHSDEDLFIYGQYLFSPSDDPDLAQLLNINSDADLPPNVDNGTPMVSGVQPPENNACDNPADLEVHEQPAESNKKKVAIGKRKARATKGENTEKGRRFTFVGGPSDGSRQPVKRAKGKLKNANDKISRRIISAWTKDLCAIIDELCPGVIRGKKGFVRPELIKIQTLIEKSKKEAEEMEEQGKMENEIANNMKNRLEEVEKHIKRYDEASKRDSSKNNQAILDVVETIRQYIRADPCEGKYGIEALPLLELQNELSCANKKTVLFSSFPGLQEQLVNLKPGEIPVYLKDIAGEINMAFGITESDEKARQHHNTLLLSYAAVHEMKERVGVEELEWDRLLTWAAACNKARDDGFQVTFFEQHLKKVLYAYCFGRSDDMKERVRKLKDKLIRVLKDCQSAEKSFEGKSLINGLFPQ